MTTQLLIEQLRASRTAPDVHYLCKHAADILEILTKDVADRTNEADGLHDMIDDLYDRIQDLQDEYDSIRGR